jgi:hypothetical protein
MTMPIQATVDTYVKACMERNPARRAALLERCFSENGRMVTASQEIVGRAGLLKMLDRFWADPDLLGVRVTTVVDAKGTIFRYRAIADFANGRTAEAFDAGEIDASGRISLILTFAGPLTDSTGDE